MLNENNEQLERSGSMHHREITLADGRYMIFYTFDDADSSADAEIVEHPTEIKEDNDV